MWLLSMCNIRKKVCKVRSILLGDIQSAACINSLANNYSGTESGISLCINDITLRESVSVYFCLKSIMAQTEWLLPALLAIVLKVGLSKTSLSIYIRMKGLIICCTKLFKRRSYCVALSECVVWSPAIVHLLASILQNALTWRQLPYGNKKNEWRLMPFQLASKESKKGKGKCAVNVLSSLSPCNHHRHHHLLNCL